MPRYRVEPLPAAHRWRVTLELPAPAAQQRLSMAAWTPGSYMRRDYVRHVMAIGATQRGRPVALQREGLAGWVAACSGRAALTVVYEVHALDSSVRGCWVDAARGFINGPALFLRAEGHESQPHTVAFQRLPRGWTVATAMRSAGAGFEAADHDELLDHPFALGEAWRGTFTAAGVPHEFVVQGAWPRFDGARLLADARRICETQLRFWHGRGRPPFERYVFLLNVRDEGYGGLEHRASTALACARRDLPREGVAELSDGYANLLALVSHEYFHAWNVQRIRPQGLAGADLSREQPSPLLWFFEGFTSYYDELMLLRAGLVDRARWLRQVAKAINATLATPGRHVQSLADASWDAWTRYYQRDANTPNATVNYYDRGALVGLLTDLALRRAGQTLDAVMRGLLKHRQPIGEAEILAALPAAVAAELHGWVHGTGELPLAPALQAFGVALRREQPPLAAQLGLKLAEGAFTGIQVQSVLAGSAAEAAGLAPGDELLAADGWRLRRLDDLRQWVAPGAAFTLTLVRDQRLATLRVQPAATPAAPQVALADDERAGADALALRRAWLGG